MYFFVKLLINYPLQNVEFVIHYNLIEYHLIVMLYHLFDQYLY